MKKNSPGTAKKRGPAARITASLILAVTALFCFITMAQVLTKGYVSLFGYSMFRVVTDSMEPEISVGALLASRNTDIEDISENDIVCFRSKNPDMLGRIITHRVIGITEGKNNEINLQTKGDANASVDLDYVTSSNLIGKVVWKSSDSNIMAVLLSVLTDKFGFFTLIIIPVLLIITLVLNSSISKIKRELELKKQEIDNISSGTDEDATLTAVPEENYTDMYERIKAEMLEEMAQGAETETEKTTIEESENAGAEEPTSESGEIDGTVESDEIVENTGADSAD